MQIERLAAVADSDRLAGWLKDIDDLRDNLLVNLNRRVATDALFVSMAGKV
jgi:hypothetical protein